MKKIMILVFLTSFVLMPAQSFALSCAEPSPVKIAYDEYDAVLVGEVKDINRNNNMKMLIIEVGKSYKGVETKTITVYEDITWGESQKNAEYLFFLNQDAGKWIHPLCSPTTHKTELADEAYAEKEEVVLQEVESSGFDSNNTTVIVLMSLLVAGIVIAGVWISLSNRRNKI
ncbi:hypothetical protein [Planococcus halotolerans]|uniref:CbiN domain protein n=1 Tax=Planococcus halotolerans TaxID=2233542 RepID=A0A365KXI4_9BACL|nr:hypothetical protein [Planococcus halotolerans]QHJ72144.1 hypothetical protein DNR44_016740 [Planococcus halotolerans]RAZ77840.1 hypothetical protein DP120_10190 [Planococcus halotolerans]